MSTRFLPTQETVLNAWLKNFSTKISASPATYGLTAGDAGKIAASVAAWAAAFDTASSPATRTRPAVAAKRGAKEQVVALVRGVAARVRANDAVSDADKISLGLKLRRPGTSPVPPPVARPALALRSFDYGVQEVLALNDGAQGLRAKPPGVAGLVVFRAVEEGVVSDPEQAQYLTFVTKGRFQSTFSEAQRGLTATYFARWVNTRGQAGPWSVPMSARIAA